jgi:hypothetical protein
MNCCAKAIVTSVIYKPAFFKTALMDQNNNSLGDTNPCLRKPGPNCTLTVLPLMIWWQKTLCEPNAESSQQGKSN